MLLQLHPFLPPSVYHRAIVILESNLGYLELHGLLQSRCRETISAEQAQRVLKDLIFERWLKQGCEDRTDTLKMVGLIDIFLPFFPLEAEHLRALFESRLKERSEALEASGIGRLVWQSEVVDHLLSLVEFDGAYPIEGAKEVGILLTKTVSRPVRLWAERVHGPGGNRREHAAAHVLPECRLVVVRPPSRPPSLECA